MLKPLKFRNEEIKSFFIDENAKIYDSNGVEQEQFLYHRYYHFKGKGVHVLMCHSFFGYKEGFDVHHKNEIKTDNRLENLSYLTHEQHTRLHMTGNKYSLGKKHSVQTKAKMRIAHIGKNHSEQSKIKMCAAQDKNKKKVYCVELDAVFESINAASRELSLNPGNVSQCCQGKYKTTGGYRFEYFD